MLDLTHPLYLLSAHLRVQGDEPTNFSVRLNGPPNLHLERAFLFTSRLRTNGSIKPNVLF
jgi:hypothetical protein